ncbi:MerR family transcriptional regulator [Sulfobacillus sp. hq2]|uniref:HTH merR-type domain-containing protein n=1 Tax=Sulfobacillus thermotolerans TaxID=338644 RepID=A0ABM6RUT3_9FIRM|nr:MerR family transcriptional regulator [Sulfobacillus sp. hq2]AUW95091.1 hypothetical protein BXT84_14950 [Sulfobacillus thermotolerans]MCY0908609.1 MerR family transcriptional regulator [Sulfobacillus thermotolerans]POB10304.1 hypothetical protein CO251_10140 [Sulfobacillus sp. hq2]
MEPTHEMQIGELAQICQTTTRTLRYYEDIGLIEPLRRLDGGFRVYGPETVTRIRHIQELKELLGWSLEEVRGVVQAEDAVESLRSQYRQSRTDQERLAVVKQATGIIEGQLARVEERIDRLAQMRQRLQAKLTRYAELEEELAAHIRSQEGSV